MQRKVNCVRYAKLKFRELDCDNSGFLENSKLDKVVEWVLELEDVSD